MKHLITILLLLFVFLNINAQEPQMKFYLNDGTERTYNISDLEEMSFIKSDVFSYMSIYFIDSTKANFDTKSIEKMEISEENELLSVYTCGYPYNYEISTIDSIIFGYEIDNLYETITIGEQVWMQYNLDVCHYRNGDPILHVQTYEEWLLAGTQGIGAWCYYDNDPENGKIYGKLYNWYAVNDERGLAPDGWEVASDLDWVVLEICLGMPWQDATRFYMRGNPVGTKLASNYELWKDGDLRNHNDFNNSGFKGLPSGYCTNDGIHYGLANNAGWWSSSAINSNNAIARILTHSDTYVYREPTNFGHGFSVRCIKYKGGLGLTTPWLQSPINKSIEHPTEIEFEWGPISNATTYQLQISKSENFTDIFKNFEGIQETYFKAIELEKGAEYFWRVRAVKDNEQSNWSEVWGFMTSELETLIIGNYMWMKYDLDVTHYRNGDEIFNATTDDEWFQAGVQGKGAWRYFLDDPENGEIYGKLYNWFAVNDERGIAPEGWRVASDDDWQELEIALGMTQSQAASWSWRGGPIGAKLAGGYELWIDGILRNHDDFNSLGFEGRPGGYINQSGRFLDLRRIAYWWTSSERSGSSAINRQLSFESTNVRRSSYNTKRSGFFVRCVRDE